jgi:uncharacterized membrane protein YfcA
LFESIITLGLLIVVGLAAGTLGSMLGVGGGIIMVPALTFLNVPPIPAASTSLIAVTSTSISSAIEYSRQKKIEYRLGLEMAACAIPGAILGAIISNYLPAASFKIFFGVLLICTGLYILYRNLIIAHKAVRSSSRALRALLFSVAFCAGVISSLFGVGGGIIFVPAMLLILGLTMQRAAATSQLSLLLTSISGVFTHSYLGHPDYVHAVALSVGAFAGAQVGARISRATKETILQQLLGIMLMAVAIVFILNGLDI